ncbi:MAG: 50S ribosomal protein L20 [Candidatus Nomurabacteria bacterium]|nr:50S ribosomal protein L20 [Candidatus Nomurabacteria bacterium]
MTRVKKGVHALKRRRSVLKQTKGMRQERNRKERSAKDALLHAGAYSFAHRKDKKSYNRKLWNIKINAESRVNGMSYSKMIGALAKKKIMLDRKILADLAENNPEIFAKILATVK